MATSTPANVFSVKSVLTTTKKLEHEVGEFNIHEALITASELLEMGTKFAKTYFSGALHLEAPLPVARKTLQILTSDDIQYCTELKATLSKACRVFLECVLIKTRSDHLKMYTSTKEDLLQSLKRVINTVPRKEVEMRYDLRCAEAVVKALDTPAYLKELILVGLKATINSEFGSLIKPLEKAWTHESQASEWFPMSLTWRWMATQVETLEHFSVLKQEITYCQKTSKDISQSKALVYSELLDSETSLVLKTLIINELEKLLADDSWRTRLIVVNAYLKHLHLKDLPDPKELLIVLTKVLCVEENYLVLEPILNAYQSPDEHDVIGAQWREVIQQTIKRNELEDQIQKVAKLQEQSGAKKATLNKELATTVEITKKLQSEQKSTKATLSGITQKGAGISLRLKTEIGRIDSQLLNLEIKLATIEKEVSIVEEEHYELGRVHESLQAVLSSL